MGNMFISELEESGNLESVDRLKITLYGSLSLTGKGHLTDVAVILGLSGCKPDEVKTVEIETILHRIEASGQLVMDAKHYILFNREQDIIFSKEFLPEHENALTIKAIGPQEEVVLEKTYFSVGGGFVVEREKYQPGAQSSEEASISYDYASAAELKEICEKENITLDEVVLRRDSQFLSRQEINAYLHEIWNVMQAAVAEGINPKNKGKELPGCLKLKRRAPGLYEALNKEGTKQDDLTSLDWMSAFAMAVNEESAAGHRVVTAPTNGSCGVIPAVMVYYSKIHGEMSKEMVEKFLLTSCAVGYLYRRNATISGAEAGCQAEIGASSSMAAAGLCAIMGGDINEIFTAAEIAMEHHLGMTCDPIAGLVQVPCIERNAFGAVKAVLSTRMALEHTGEPIVSLDDIIATMYKTGKDMDRGYRETSLKGLAAQIKCPVCQ